MGCGEKAGNNSGTWGGKNLEYTYDALDRLVKEYDKEQSLTTEFSYDSLGNCLSRKDSRGLTTYIYSGLGQRVNSTLMGPDRNIYDRDYVIDYTSEEYNDLMEYNTVHTQWNGDRKVHALKHLYTEDGNRLETDVERYNTWSSEVIAYKINVHEDILGSGTYYTRQNNGTILNKHMYDIWGFNTKAPSYNYDPEYRATEPYFTGHPYDGALNLYYAHNRFYDAQTGQWLSEDPIRSGLNWYQYCGSNPVSFVDLLGLYKDKNLGITGKVNKTVKKAYIIIEKDFMGDTWEPEQYLYYEEELRRQTIEALKDNDTVLEVKYVSGKEEFIDLWNNEMESSIELLVLDLHADVDRILFGLYAGYPYSEFFTANELEKLLVNKDIEMMINLGCNVGGYVVKDKEDIGDVNKSILPLAFSWLKKGVKELVVSRGAVTIDMPFVPPKDCEDIAPLILDEKRDPVEFEPNEKGNGKGESGYFFLIQGCGDDLYPTKIDAADAKYQITDLDGEGDRLTNEALSGSAK